jgi:hypothetical protein
MLLFYVRGIPGALSPHHWAIFYCTDFAANPFNMKEPIVNSHGYEI